MPSYSLVSEYPARRGAFLHVEASKLPNANKPSVLKLPEGSSSVPFADIAKLPSLSAGKGYLSIVHSVVAV